MLIVTRPLIIITISTFSASSLTYMYLFKHTHTQIHDASFLEKMGQSVKIENSQLYSDFIHMIDKYQQLDSQNMVFVPAKKSPSHLDQAFFYFTNSPEKVIAKEDILTKINSGQILVWEKEKRQLDSLPQNYQNLYQNQHFYLLKKP